MNRPVARPRQFAFALARLGHWLLPASRAEWAEAMLSELHYVKDDRSAILWAVGYVVTGIKERVNTMITGNLNIPRWILVPEMLLCFVPITIGWLDSVVGSSGIIRLNAEVIQKYFLDVPGGTTALTVMVSVAVLGILGPVGLLAALRLIALERPINRRLGIALIGGPVLLGIAMIVMNPEFATSRQMFLVGVLPALGAAHMLCLTASRPTTALHKFQ